MVCTYLRPEFVSEINGTEISTIVECGSRDALDAIRLLNYYHPSIVYSFECNPESIPVCKANIADEKRIVLVPKAVCNVNTSLPFFATDMEKSVDKNIGASSLFQYRNINQKEYIQKRIRVNGIRLDTFMEKNNIEKIDLLCMDLQGAEHLAINGLGKRTKDVRYIISEVTTRSFYKRDMVLGAFRDFMSDKGFTLLIKKGDDALFKYVG